MHEIGSLEIYPTDHPDTVIGEWSVKGHVIPTGNAYNMWYATFVTVRDDSGRRAWTLIRASPRLPAGREPAAGG